MHYEYSLHVCVFMYTYTNIIVIIHEHVSKYVYNIHPYNRNHVCIFYILSTNIDWDFLFYITFCFQSSSQMSEDEQIMQAIALSLGQDVAAEEKAKQEEEAKKKEKEEKERKKEEEKRIMTPVSKEELDEFSDILLYGCLELSVAVNDSVAGIVDLLSAVGKRNEDEWREKALIQIKEKVHSYHAEFQK